MSASNGEPSLRVAARIDGKKLLVDYEIRNEGDTDLYAANAMSDWFGTLGDPELDASRNRDAAYTASVAYACHDGGDRVVLVQGNTTLPPGPSPTDPRGVKFRKLSPGEAGSWSIVAPLPLREWDAFQPPRRVATWPVTVSEVELRIAYVVDPEEGSYQPHGTFPGIYLVSMMRAQTLTATAPLPKPCKLARRIAGFRRFC